MIKHQNKHGFALIELSIVIALMIIITLLTVQGFSFYNRLFLHAELDRLYTLFIAASRRAAVDNQPHEIIFDETQRSYKYTATHGYTTQKLADGVIFGLLPGVKGPPAHPKGIVRHPITFEKRRITFSSDGRIQPGTLYITDTKKRWQYAISSPVGTISYVRRYTYDNQQWKRIS